MSSIILQLQEMATEANGDLLTLVRKTQLVSTKLQLEEIRLWTERELNGYEKKEDLPTYRILHAHLRAQDAYRNDIPVMIKDPDFHKMAHTVEYYDSLPTIIDVIEKYQPGYELHYPFTPGQMSSLHRAFGNENVYVNRIIQISGLKNIVEQTRNSILKWSLELEKKGIMGDNLSFTSAEKEKAKGSSSIVIQNFHGILGDVSKSTVTQSGSILVNSNDIESLTRYLTENGISRDDVNQLREAIQKEPKIEINGGFGPMVSNWIGKMVQNAASGSWQIGVGAAGNLLATAIQKFYGMN